MSDIRRFSRRTLNGALLCALAAGCVTPPPGTEESASPDAAAPVAPPTPPAPPPAAAPPPPPILPFAEAVSTAATKVLSSAPAPDSAPAVIVIDPLVDGLTGYQSKATAGIQARIMDLAKGSFRQYTVQPISAATLKQQPRFLIGTFTPINADLKPAGQRESYWFCLVMGDLKSGKIIAKAVARARMEDVDATPTATFGDSPVWTEDPSIQAYVATCKGSKVGDDIKPEYLDGLLAAALVSEASATYDDGHYDEALTLYQAARKSPAGEQLRVYNGIYLCLVKLGRTDEAAQAFGDIVQYGLHRKRLAVKFLFQPGSVRLASDSNFSGSYNMWMQQIAARAASAQACLQITGHTSPTGPAALNERLSLLRAEYIQTRLEDYAAPLKQRTLAAGKGSRENLIGTGRDDSSDMLDRRVELSPIEPCTNGRVA